MRAPLPELSAGDAGGSGPPEECVPGRKYCPEGDFPAVSFFIFHSYSYLCKVIGTY